jgi:hypothetical protein
MDEFNSAAARLNYLWAREENLRIKASRCNNDEERGSLEKEADDIARQAVLFENDYIETQELITQIIGYRGNKTTTISNLRL